MKHFLCRQNRWVVAGAALVGCGSFASYSATIGSSGLPFNQTQPWWTANQSGVALAAALTVLAASWLFFFIRARRQTRGGNDELLRSTAKFSDIEYFHFDHKNRKNMLLCDRHWPQENGLPIAAAQWVAAADLEAFSAAWRKLLDGEVTFLRITYQAGLAEPYRDYVMCAERSEAGNCFIGFIQDVSELKRAQQDAEESKLILQTVLDNVHAGVTFKDPDGDFRYLVWNQWLSAKTGLSAEQVVGKQDFELPVCAAVQQIFRDNDLKACETGFGRMVMTKPEKDGHLTISDVTRKLLTLPRGKRLLITSVSDLTQERELASERELMIAQQNNYIEYERIINRCLQEITLQSTLEESIAFLLREIGETTMADRCYIFELAEDDFHTSNTHEWFCSGLPSQRKVLQNIDIRDFPDLHRCLLDKKDFVFEDTSRPTPELFPHTVAFLRHHKVQSAIISGIWENGRLWGFIGIDFIRTLRTFTPCDTHIIRNAANLFLLAREREHRINALADSVSLQTQVFDNISVPIILLDTDFNVVKTNSAMEQRARAPLSPGCGDKCYHRFCEGKTKCPALCPAREVMNSGKSYMIERHFGSQHVQISAQPIFDRNGNLIYILESGHDVSALRQQQEQLALHLGQERIISECLKIMVLNQDFDATLKEIISRLGTQLEVDCCTVYRYDAAENAFRHMQKWVSSPEAMEEDSLWSIAEKDYPKCFQILRNGEPLSVDLRSEENKPEKLELRPYLTMRKMQAMVCIGIGYRGTLWGHIRMENANPQKYFSDAEMRLLASAARIIEILLEREALYAKLLNSENEKNRIWELMTVPMVLFDANRKILRVNPAMERLCNLTSEEIMARPCCQTICKNSVPDEECPVSLLLHDLEPQHKEFSLFDREFDIFTLPVLENGAPVRILQIFIDITENNANKRKLLQAVEAAEAAARAKSTFLATMSHEIRTPLNAVIGFSELLQCGEVARAEQLEYLRSINFAGNALLQLINDILDLSKLESGQMEIVCEKADLRKLCEEMIAIFSLRAKEKGLELLLDYPDGVPSLYLSVLRLRQVLLNLIGNAVKFTTSGSITIAVEFAPQNEQVGTLRICVRDTGIGISGEWQKRIFQPFVQQGNTRSQQEGTGLGLVISKRLVEHMGGVLQLESTLDAGSCFGIELPQIRYGGMPDDVPPPSAPMASQVRRTILLVDDVPLNLKVLQAMLKQFNAQVVTAASGREALEKLQSCKPDLILTDMWMPEMNGVELAKQIRLMPGCEGVVMLAVTADSEANNTFSMECFDGVLLKPVSIDKLHKMFQLMEHHQLGADKSVTL